MSFRVLDSNGNTKTTTSGGSSFSSNNTWTGSNTFNGEVDFGADVHLKSVISPTALANGNNNDWNPTGLATANAIRISTNASGSTLTGITAPASAGQLIYFENIGTGTLTLTSQDTNSLAANRFILSASIVLQSGDGGAIWYDGTSSRWRFADAAAGSVSTGTFSSRPVAGAAGRLYFPNDGVSIAEDNGTKWNPWGPLYPLTAPIDANFSWMNQGGATVTATKDAVYLDAPTNTGDSLRIRYVAAPATPYTVTLGFTANLIDTNAQCGLILSDGTKVISFTIVVAASGTTPSVPILLMDGLKWTNTTTFSALYSSIGFMPSWPLFMRLNDNGTNRTYSFSFDGQNFVTYLTTTNTDFLTATRVGFYVEASSNNTFHGGMNVLHWTGA